MKPPPNDEKEDLVKNYLFDLDGTLADTLPFCIRAFRAALEPLTGRSFTDLDITSAFGPSEEGMIARLLPARTQAGIEAYIEHYETLHSQCPKPFEGILDVLHFLKSKGAFVGLVTGKGPRSTAITLKRFGLDAFFDTVRTGALSGPVKDICIEEILAEFHLSRGETLYVGDSPLDILAARKCGITMVAAAWAPTADATQLESMDPDFLFTSVAALAEFAEQSCGN